MNKKAIISDDEIGLEDVRSKIMSELDSFLVDAVKGKDYPFENTVGGHALFGIYNSSTIGFLIECSTGDKDFNEEFSGMSIHSEQISFSGSVHSGLMLCCRNERYVKNSFLCVCESFLFPSSGTLENNIANPDEWADNWKKLVGNKQKHSRTYQIIGELLLLKELKIKGYQNIIWVGPDGDINDVIASNGTQNLNFEVKSTIQRSGMSIIVSEEYQVMKAGTLVFYRFESTPTGNLTLKSVVSSLVNLGFSKDDLCSKIENKLNVKNSSEHKLAYNLIEEKVFPVDEDFPDITKAFVDGKKPKNIGKISYEIDLSGLKTSHVLDLNHKQRINSIAVCEESDSWQTVPTSDSSTFSQELAGCAWPWRISAENAYSLRK
ncbi:PD-(D/E)XK motif protein [Methanomassiliicoccales archaeon LGM-DZ1]|nr:PD-(D/E)XK motif protein [Methanomassiliicoccales archaeon LGM-DZ1]